MALLLSGEFVAECRRPGGAVAWRERFSNGITTAGLTSLLEAAFAAGTQLAAWYAGLIDNAGFTALDPADTMPSHAGWSEWTGYSGNRPQWAPLSARNGLISNTAPAAWVINQAGTVKGMLLASGSTPGGTSGVLWSTAAFNAPRAVLAGQTLSFSYILKSGEGVA